MAEDDAGQLQKSYFFMKRMKMASNWTEKCTAQRSRGEMILLFKLVSHIIPRKPTPEGSVSPFYKRIWSSSRLDSS